MSGTTETITQVEDVKRESYGIELGMIQDMYEAGDINRAQARSPEAQHLRYASGR